MYLNPSQTLDWIRQSVGGDASEPSVLEALQLRGRLLQALRAGKVEAWGRRANGSAHPAEQIEPAEWASLVLKTTDTVVVAAEDHGEHDGGRDDFGAGWTLAERGPGRTVWESLRFNGQSLRRAFPAGRKPRVPYNVGGRKACEAWLEGLMKEGPRQKPKSQYGEEALPRFRISSRCFLTAWKNAGVRTRDPHGWRRPGRTKGSKKS